MDFVDYLGIRYTQEAPDCVRAELSVIDNLRQPFGFLHGGATISLLETVASRATALHADLDTELPFGIDIHVSHYKNVTQGVLHGEARLAKCEVDSKGYRKMLWNVVACNDEGDVCSGGAVLCLIVPKTAVAR